MLHDPRARTDLCAGFSLIEISVVLVVVALVVGAVVITGELKNAAELRAVIREIRKFETAVHTFKAKYHALPGDIPDALDYWPQCNETSTYYCNGDGDGIIDIDTGVDEGLQAWQHLSLAGLIESKYQGHRTVATGQRLIPGFNVPPMPMRGGGLRILCQETPVSWYGTFGNHYQFGAPLSLQLNGYVLTPKEAYTIDLKMDDGISRSGKVETRGGGGLPCVVSNGVLGPGWNYNLARTDVVCELRFFW